MNLAKTLVLFVLAIIGGFVVIGNSIPQITIEVEEVATEIGETPGQLIAAGKAIFASDRAQCLTCHSLGEDPKARCPNQAGLGERARTRKAGMSAAEYLIESVYNPNAYVVSGYPKNQMTPVNKPPIALSHDKILAVVAYLNSLGGVTDEAFIEEVRLSQGPWRKGLLVAESTDEEVHLPILPGDEARGAEIFETVGCILCHQVGDEGASIGPELTAIGASQSASYILESVLEPYRVIVKGYKQTIVIWKDDMREDLYGVPIEWIPSKEEPEQVRLSVPVEDAAKGSGDFFGGGMEDDSDFFGTEEVEAKEDDDFFGTEEEPPQDENIIAGTDRAELVINLAEVAYIGDTVVAVETDNNFVRYAGDYVEGDEESGIVLSLMEGGLWNEKHIPPDDVSYMTHPMSVMPEDFATTMRPKEVYDLVAYLVDQKGSR